MKKKNLKRLAVLAGFVGIILLVRYLNVGQYINLAAVRHNLDTLELFVANNFSVAILGFIGLYILFMTFSIPVSAVMTLTGGFLFGTVVGALASNIGATLGSVVSFLIVRYALGAAMRERHSRRLEAFNREFDRHGYLYLLTIRLVVLFPPAVGNILAGLANVSLVTFLWTSSLGMLPGSFVFAFTGQQLRTIRSVRDVFSGKVLLAAALLALLSLIPMIFRVARSRSKKS